MNDYPNKLSGTIGYLFRNKSFHPNTLKNQRGIDFKISMNRITHKPTSLLPKGKCWTFLKNANAGGCIHACQTFLGISKS